MPEPDKTTEKASAEADVPRKRGATPDAADCGAAPSSQSLEDQERLLLTFMEYAPASVAMFDRDMRYLAASNRWISDYGLTGRTLTGLCHYDVFPEIPERWKEIHRRCLAGAVEHTEEDRFDRADGATHWLRWEVRPWYASSGAVGGIVIFTEDISARKRAEDALQESEERFRTLANAIPQLCWMADAQGWIFWYNQRWYDYTGSTPEQMEGWGWQSVHDPSALPRVLELWRASIASGAPFDMVFPLRGKDGEFRPFLTRGMPVFDHDGNVVRWCGTNTDISENRRLEEDLQRRVQERTAELERKNKELRDFTRVASHDLQEPLRKVRAFGDRLRLESGHLLNELGRDSLARMEKAAGRMQDLIDALLVYSGLSAGLHLFQPVDLNKVVAEALEDLEVRLAETEGHVEVGGLPVIEADAVQMRQLFENLITNSLKFHSPGVAPVVRIEASFPDGDRRRCEITVADNGIGFDERFLSKIFTPFQRLHDRKEFQGTGIGLTIVRNIVERHKGTIRASSRPDEGAAFTVTLPTTHE